MNQAPDSVEKGNPDDEPLILHGYGRIGNTISCLSPLVGKVELFLRMNDIPYEVDYTMKALQTAPKGLLPYIKHGDVVLGDSTFIIDYLINTFGEKIKVKPSSDPKAAGLAVAVQRLCEDHLYFGELWFRWAHPDGWLHLKPKLFKNVPFPFSMFVPGKVRKDVCARLQTQGFGRHSLKDLYKVVETSLSALSGILGENKYILGNEPCPQDCAVFGILDNILNTGFDPVPIRDLAVKYPNLVAYVDNMRDTYFPPDNPSKF